MFPPPQGIKLTCNLTLRIKAFLTARFNSSAYALKNITLQVGELTDAFFSTEKRCCLKRPSPFLSFNLKGNEQLSPASGHARVICLQKGARRRKGSIRD